MPRSRPWGSGKGRSSTAAATEGASPSRAAGPSGVYLLEPGSVPLTGEGRVLGCLNLASRTLHDVPAQAREASEAMAVPCGSILGRLLAERDLARYREHLEELVETRTRELVAARQAAEAANRAKSASLSSMSHELRTPMNGVLGFAQLSATDPSLPEVHRELFRRVSAATLFETSIVIESRFGAAGGTPAPRPAGGEGRDRTRPGRRGAARDRPASLRPVREGTPRGGARRRDTREGCMRIERLRRVRRKGDGSPHQEFPAPKLGIESRQLRPEGDAAIPSSHGGGFPGQEE